MSDGAGRLSVWEFLHCYCPNEIAQAKGMYNFMPRSPLLRLVCETPDSNRNWKSRYFFMEGDCWISHLGDNEFMPVDTTWGILPSSGRFCHVIFKRLLLQFVPVHKFLLKSGVFWREFLTSPS